MAAAADTRIRCEKCISGSPCRSEEDDAPSLRQNDKKSLKPNGVTAKVDMKPSRAGVLVAVGIGVGAALGTAFHALALGLALGAAGGAVMAIVVRRR